MKKNSIDVLLVVLYKTKVENSTTIQSYLLNCAQYYDKIKLIIWDNSPDASNIEDFKSIANLNYRYYHTPENLSLSVIYNRVADLYPDSEFIYYFDQDSEITDQYFKQQLIAAQNHPDINLFVPIIEHHNKIFSPAKRQLHRGIYYKTRPNGIVDSDHFIAIMSGMCVKTQIVANKIVRFDENLTLYGIDTKFSIDFSKKYTQLYVLDYTLNHSLSVFDDNDKDSLKRRYKNHIRASLYIARQISPIAFITCLIAVVKNYIINKYKMI